MSVKSTFIFLLHIDIIKYVFHNTKTSDFPWLKLAQWNTKRQYAIWWTIERI